MKLHEFYVTPKMDAETISRRKTPLLSPKATDMALAKNKFYE